MVPMDNNNKPFIPPWKADPKKYYEAIYGPPFMVPAATLAEGKTVVLSKHWILSFPNSDFRFFCPESGPLCEFYCYHQEIHSADLDYQYNIRRQYDATTFEYIHCWMVNKTKKPLLKLEL
jgi:hypothetical protein